MFIYRLEQAARGFRNQTSASDFGTEEKKPALHYARREG
jgi:hypothetical protein